MADAPPQRRLTLADAMVLVATVAAGVAWLRSSRLDLVGLLPGRWTLLAAAEYAAVVTWGLLPILLLCTFATAALRLRRPQPPWRRLGRQPRTVACVTATLVASITAAAVPVNVLIARTESGVRWATLSTWDPRDWLSTLLEYLGFLSPVIGLAVASAWLALAWNRRFRPEPDWIDRLGRALGCCWLAMIPIQGLYWNAFGR